MKKIFSILIVFCLIFSMAACGSSSSADPSNSTELSEQPGSSESELPPFQISMITPITGTNAFGGAEFKQGAELALEHMGGEINGRKVELVFADGPTQDATLAEFERLYNSGSRVFLSGYGCLADRTFATMCDDMEVLYLSLNWDSDLIQGESTYFFRGGANVIDFSGGTAVQAASIGETYLGIEPQDLKIAVVTNSAIEAVTTPFMAYAESLGLNIVLFESYPIDTLDYTPIITKLQQTDYDILVPFQTQVDGTPFQQKMYEMGYTPNVIIGAGIYYDTPIFAELGDEITNGILSQSYTAPSISDEAAPGVAKFREDYIEKYGYAPLTHALQAYGAMFVYKNVLETVDPADWEDTLALATAMKNLKIDYGELPWYWGVEFDEMNNNTKASEFIVCQWIDGELECVFPEKLRTTEPVIPWNR